MTARPARVWPVVLAAMTLLTIVAALGYVIASLDETTSGDLSIPPEERMVIVNRAGAIVVLDRRAPHQPGVTIVESGFANAMHLAMDDGGRAYLATEDAGEAIRVVELDTGRVHTIGDGRAVTVGNLAFPQLAATVERPTVTQAAYVTEGGNGPRVVVENLVTGATHRLEPFGDDAPFTSVDHLAWSPFDNRLFGIADDGARLFRLDADRAESLDDAVMSPRREVGTWTGLAAYRDGVAALHHHPGAGTDVVEIDPRTLRPSQRLGNIEGAITINSDPAARDLLVTTDAGDLFHLTPDGEAEFARLRDGVRRADW